MDHMKGPSPVSSKRNLYFKILMLIQYKVTVNFVTGAGHIGTTNIPSFVKIQKVTLNSGMYCRLFCTPFSVSQLFCCNAKVLIHDTVNLLNRTLESRDTYIIWTLGNGLKVSVCMETDLENEDTLIIRTS